MDSQPLFLYYATHAPHDPGWDNILFVASGDNGGPIRSDRGANNYPLKGGKGTNRQRRVRVNILVSGGYLPKSMCGRRPKSTFTLPTGIPHFSH